MTQTNQHVTIRVDPIYDLYAAGWDIEEAEDFVAAYRAAADALLDGIADVTVESNRGGTHRDEIGADAEIVDGGNLWQTVHDCIDRTDDGRWIVMQNTVADLRTRLLRAIAAQAQTADG